MLPKQNHYDALYKAIKEKNLTTIKRLIRSHYFNFKMLDKKYKTIMDHACNSKDVDIIRYFLPFKIKIGILFYSIIKEKQFLEYINILYRAGFDINSHDMVGYSPLHYASSLGFLEAIGRLAEMGAILDNKATDGKTPIEHSFKIGEKYHLGIVIGHS